MKLSIVIPCLNEEKHLGVLINSLLKNTVDTVEIIVVDGGSTDSSCNIAITKGVRLIKSEKSGRAHQLNLGAKHAHGDVFYFVHADTLPPENYFSLIEAAVQKGKPAGCFAYQFDSGKLMLRFNAWFTKFKGFYTGGGDQTLFVTKEVFHDLHGFDENFVIMEDFDFVKRIRKKYPFKILKETATVSSRKYAHNHYFRVQWANTIALLQFKFGVHPHKIKTAYKRRIKST